MLFFSAVIVFFSACSAKNSPTTPQDPVFTPTITPTHTISETSTVSETITETYTVTETETDTVSPTVTVTLTQTETHTITPTFTVTPTETPFYLDNFEDGNEFNNINPYNNPWSGYVNIPDAASNTYTLTDVSICSNCGSGGGRAMTAQGWVHTDNPDGTGGYFSSYGIRTPLLFAPSTGLNFSIYRFLYFKIVSYVWASSPPFTGTYKFKVRLFDGSGRVVEQELAGLAIAWGFQPKQINISDFVLPAGASGYTAADVLANAEEIRWEFYASSSSITDYTESVIWLDDIWLEK